MYDPKLEKIIKDGDAWLTPQEYFEKYGHDCPISPLPWQPLAPTRYFPRWADRDLRKTHREPFPPKKTTED